MSRLNPTQSAQERLYAYPYHYLPRYADGQFSNARILTWGHEYLSYLFFVLEIAQRLPFRSLLDVGCGDGHFLFEARRVFPDRRLAGVDVFAAAVPFARAFNPDLDIRCANIAAGPPGEPFDLIISIETLEHVAQADLAAFVRGLSDHSVPGGRLVLTSPTTNIPVSPKHVQHFTAASLAAVLAPYFTVEHLYYLNRTSRLASALQRLFLNRFYAVVEPRLLGLAYRAYCRHCLHAEAGNARRLCAILVRAAP